MLSAIQATLLSVLRAQLGGRSAPADPRLEIRFFIKNPSDLKLVFETEKAIQTAPKPSKKRQTITPKFIKLDFSEQHLFAILSLRKPRFVSPQRGNVGLESDKQVTWKQARQKMTFRAS